jgi:hypothetical protein
VAFLKPFSEPTDWSRACFAAELGYGVTMVKDATADYSDEMMHAALDINIIEDTKGVELFFISIFHGFSLVFDDTTDELKSLIEFGGCFTVKSVVKPSFIRQVVARRQPDFRKL